MGELEGAAEIVQDKMKRMAEGLARNGRVGAICSPLGWPLCTPFLLSREGKLMRLTRPRILEQQARGRRPEVGPGKSGVGACVGRGRVETAEVHEIVKHPGDPSRGRCWATGWERGDRALSLGSEGTPLNWWV